MPSPDEHNVAPVNRAQTPRRLSLPTNPPLPYGDADNQSHIQRTRSHTSKAEHFPDIPAGPFGTRPPARPWSPSSSDQHSRSYVTSDSASVSDSTAFPALPTPTESRTATIRRREANRLAAQRFRSRKKAHQEQLEEKIRRLEEDRQTLISHYPSERVGSAEEAVLDVEQDAGPSNQSATRSTSPQGPPRLVSSVSFELREFSADQEVRIASLEAANRKLQEDLRVVRQEKEELLEELRRWRRSGSGPSEHQLLAAPIAGHDNLPVSLFFFPLHHGWRLTSARLRICSTHTCPEECHCLVGARLCRTRSTCTPITTPSADEPAESCHIQLGPLSRPQRRPLHLCLYHVLDHACSQRVSAQQHPTATTAYGPSRSDDGL